MLNVSRPSIQRAVKVQRKATPQQVKAIEQGQKTVGRVLHEIAVTNMP